MERRHRGRRTSARRHGRGAWPAARSACQDIDPILTDLDGANTALDRIVIPQDALDRIAGMVSPRSSLIISDEGLSAETGKDTKFVVILSGEPQGSMRPRRRGVKI